MWITLLYLWSVCSYYTVFVYIWLKLVVFISLLCCQNGSKGMPLTSPKMSFSEQKSYCVGIRWDERKGDLSPGFLWFLWSFSCIEDMSRHGWGQGWVTSLLCTADISLNSVLKVSTLSARHVWSLLQAQPWHEAYWWPCSVTFSDLRVTTWHYFKECFCLSVQSCWNQGVKGCPRVLGNPIPRESSVCCFESLKSVLFKKFGYWLPFEFGSCNVVCISCWLRCYLSRDSANQKCEEMLGIAGSLAAIKLAMFPESLNTARDAVSPCGWDCGLSRACGCLNPCCLLLCLSALQPAVWNCVEYQC